MRFDWDAFNRKKIEAHGVTPREFEQAYANRILLGQALVDLERRKVVMGHTDKYRFLVLVYTMRRGKVRAITAYESREARKKWQEEQRRRR